jgi:hypothetical protein
MMTSARGENKSELTLAVGRAFQAVNLVIFVIIVLAICHSLQETAAAGASIVSYGRFWHAVPVQGM